MKTHLLRLSVTVASLLIASPSSAETALDIAHVVSSMCATRAEVYTRGDTNRDNIIDAFDAVRIQGFLFGGSMRADCKTWPELCDVDNNNIIDVHDATYIMDFQYNGTKPHPGYIADTIFEQCPPQPIQPPTGSTTSAKSASSATSASSK